MNLAFLVAKSNHSTVLTALAFLHAVLDGHLLNEFMKTTTKCIKI